MMNTTDRFWSRVDATGECWLWTGALDRDGYGRFWTGDAHTGAHRWACASTGTFIPEGHVVRHMCHNPACVNPAHLVVGTQAQNVQDRQDAGRQARGEANGRSKLTAHQVCDIRKAALAGTSQRSLARSHGVDPTTIRDILTGRIWRS